MGGPRRLLAGSRAHRLDKKNVVVPISGSKTGLSVEEVIAMSLSAVKTPTDPYIFLHCNAWIPSSFTAQKEHEESTDSRRSFRISVLCNPFKCDANVSCLVRRASRCGFGKDKRPHHVPVV